MKKNLEEIKKDEIKQETQKEIDKNDNKKKTRRIIATIIILILFLISILIISSDIFRKGKEKPEPEVLTRVSFNTDKEMEDNFNLAYDNSISDKDLKKSKEEIQNDLNQKVEKGMMNISMNLNPIATNSDSSFNLLIYNEEINHFPQTVEIVRTDTNETIYKSGVIPTGKGIKESKLTSNLPKGDHDCIAYFTSIDMDNKKELGKVGAEIKLTILN